MANTYRNTAPVSILGLDKDATGELELTLQEEADHLNAGWLEIVPREYTNVGTQEVFGTKPGKTFKAALRIDEEAALTSGGHIERVEKPVKDKSNTRSK
jgi:hypothetical protein